MIPQFKDVVNRYKPSIIFTDGEWDHPSAKWKAPELLAWLFNESNAPEDVVINDRWGKETRSSHGGYFTTEYGLYAQKEMSASHPWEECRGMGASFGYSRRETVDEYKTGDQLIQVLVQTVSRGGNLLLDIGPTADGRIPVIMQERLVQIGDWLKVNGEAIYGVKAYKTVSDGDSIFYTQKDDTVYAILFKKPAGAFILKTLDVNEGSTVTMLGKEGELRYRRVQSGLSIQNPSISNSSAAWVFKITKAK
jgi:alpha-L-fucosidase